MYNDLILMVHKLAAPLQHQTADLGGTTSCYHGIVNVSHVTGLLSSIDGVTNAIDMQVAKNKGDLE
jgi:hypothetical protein